MNSIFGTTRRDVEGSHWLSIGDLMAGQMMIFLFIAIVYMRMVVIERDKIKEVIVAWENTQESLYDDLFAEFQGDLEDWNAELERETLTVRFTEPEVLFRQGEADLQERFELILDSFFPRYVKILDKYSVCETTQEEGTRGCIEEVRIEGHTSSEWSYSVNPEQAYFFNMRLSQGRTRSVLRYALNTIDNDEHPWLPKVIAAVGFSFAHPVLDENGDEDRDRSRRVEFRVKTTVEKELMRVIRD